MTGIVPLRRPEIAVDGSSAVVTGHGVAATSIQSCAFLGNYLRGKGAQLVPATFIDIEIPASTTYVFRFRAKTRSTAIERIWSVVLRTTASGGTTAVIKAPASTGTADTVPVLSALDRRDAIEYTEVLSSKASADTELTIEITAGTSAVIVESIACREQDRPILNSDSTDYGVDTFTCSVNQPIFDGSNQSIGGVWDALQNADARRVGVFHWSVGDSTIVQRTSGTLLTIFPNVKPIVIARKIGRTATTGSLKWRAYAQMSAAGTGSVRLTTSDSGVSDTVSVTSTTPAWTAARTISVNCDDLSEADGLLGGVFDELDILIAGNGTQTLTLYAVSIWDDG